MRGPPPKDPSVRAGKHRPRATRAVLPAQSTRSTVPELPDPGDDGWHPMTARWWRDVWASPMAAEYLTADEHGLARLAVLVEAFWRQPSPAMAAEIRLQEQRYGLSPVDRRRLEWTVEQADEARDHGRRRRERQGVKQPSKSDDPRRSLHSVPPPA